MSHLKISPIFIGLFCKRCVLRKPIGRCHPLFIKAGLLYVSFENQPYFYRALLQKVSIGEAYWSLPPTVHTGRSFLEKCPTQRGIFVAIFVAILDLFFSGS